MTKSTITREQLEEWVAQLDEDGGCDATDRQLEALIRHSLAAMDSESVILYRQINPVNGMKTYWAELDPEEFRHLKQHTDENAEFMTLYRHAQPAPEYPEVLPCPVLLEPGLRFGKGIKTITMLAALARRAVYESDMTALSPEERAEFQAGIEDFKALIAQPAPASEPVYQYWCYTTVENSEGDPEEFWFWKDCEKDFYDRWKNAKRTLYKTPQPAPVVPDELNTRTANDVMNEHLSWKDYGDAEVFCIAWNACRAAMLNGGKP